MHGCVKRDKSLFYMYQSSVKFTFMLINLLLRQFTLKHF